MAVLYVGFSAWMKSDLVWDFQILIYDYEKIAHHFQGY